MGTQAPSRRKTLTIMFSRDRTLEQECQIWSRGIYTVTVTVCIIIQPVVKIQPDMNTSQSATAKVLMYADIS